MIASLAAASPQLTLFTILITFAGVFVICFMKGAFGGGFSIIGIPLLSIVMDPVTAGGLLAPLFIAMDLFALRYWKPATWSKPDLVLLLPGLVIGIAFGYLVFRVLDHRAISIVMATITLIFVGLWLVAGAQVTTRPRSTPKAVTAGLASGITTMVAHSGGPPLAMYLLPLGLKKEIYAGTTSLFFTVGNATKAVPWLMLMKPTADVWTLMAVCLFAIPTGVWLGWRLHGKLDQHQIYRVCYGLLVVTALKLFGRAFPAISRELDYECPRRRAGAKKRLRGKGCYRCRVGWERNTMNELLTKVLEGARWSGALAPPFVHDLTTLQNPGLDRMGGRDPVAGRPRPRVVAGAQGSNSIHRGTMEFTLEWG